MKSNLFFKQLIAAFLVALAFYSAAFFLIEYRRNARGPWNAVFITDYSGRPSLLLNQRQLEINNVKISFGERRVGQTNKFHSIYFDSPGKAIPFGSVLFVDTTSLPGTVVLNFWNHEVQLMSRHLTIDKREYPWKSGLTIVLPGDGKYPPNPKFKQ